MSCSCDIYGPRTKPLRWRGLNFLRCRRTAPHRVAPPPSSEICDQEKSGACRSRSSLPKASSECGRKPGNRVAPSSPHGAVSMRYRYGHSRGYLRLAHRCRLLPGLQRRAKGEKSVAPLPISAGLRAGAHRPPTGESGTANAQRFRHSGAIARSVRQA